MLEGDGSEKVWQSVTGEEIKSLWRHTYKFFYHTYEIWNLKWCLTFCCNRSILTEGEQTKTTPGKTFQTKTPWKKPCEQLRENLYRGFCPGFCTRPTKNGGSEMCDVLFGGVPGCVTKCDMGRGSKMDKNSGRCFMDGPILTTQPLTSRVKRWVVNVKCHIRFHPT